MKRVLKYKISSTVLNILLILVLPVLTLMLTEYFTHVPSDLTTIIFVVNLCVYYLIYVLCTFLLGRVDFGYLIATLFFFLFGLTNYIVMSFRSTPIVPWDIYSLKTALSVAGNYKLEVNSHLCVSVSGLLLVMFISSRLKRKTMVVQARICGIVISSVFMFLYTSAIGSDAVIQYVGLDTTLFTPKVLYRNNGLVTGFLGVMKFLKVEKPEEYGTKYVQEIVEDYESGTENETEILPNIIVIMNEAFSDPSVYGAIHTDVDYMPFIHSLHENTWKGNCYVSVKGGNTANSEYEFLTGNSLAFAPSGSVPYQQYIKSEIPSLASVLSNKGYETVAIHPYLASGWNRNTVYPLLGFGRTIFKDEFSGADTLRGYVTDEEAFQKIIDLYEEKENGKPLFAFEVTMQNHGGYSKEYEDLSEEIYLTDTKDQNTQTRAAEKYLTLIRKSDEAFQKLVEYFSSQDEKTVILMFGDHQPSDYITNVFARLAGMDTSDENTINIGHIVPYVIWSNYETTEQEMTDMSLNFLNTQLMSKAGISLTGYQMFEKELYQIFHVISMDQLRDTRNKLLEYSLDDENIRKFASLCYNLLCDKKNKEWDFFIQ